ncbi:hypothetical protein NKH77_28750 [Streptomyces sp. M19]
MAPVWDALEYQPPSGDDLDPLTFEVMALTGGEPVDSAEDLVEALMPTLSTQSMGGFRLVLRADARSLGSEPVDLVAELADELAAPVDLLLAGRDGRCGCCGSMTVVSMRISARCGACARGGRGGARVGHVGVPAAVR